MITFTESMRALLHPKSIAIVGDSPNPGFAPIIRHNIVKCGYEGEVYPINPRYDEIAGLTAYPRVDAVPGDVDLAVIGVPVRVVDSVLEQCEQAGVKAINIITSGYGEQGDAEASERQEHLRDFAERTGIRIVGPNCLGNISVPAKMCAMSGAFEHLTPGPVGLVLQSGLLAYSLFTPPMDRNMGFSYVVTTGNEADLEAADLMRYYVEDDETRVIGAFIEQFRDYGEADRGRRDGGRTREADRHLEDRSLRGRAAARLRLIPARWLVPMRSPTQSCGSTGSSGLTGSMR